MPPHDTEDLMIELLDVGYTEADEQCPWLESWERAMFWAEQNGE